MRSFFNNSISGSGTVVVNGVVMSGQGRQVQGSGRRASEQRHIPDFHGIELAAGVDVRYVTGAEPRLVIAGDDNLLELVTTVVDQGILIISTTPNVGYSSSSGIVIECSSRQLEMLAIEGSGDADARGLHADRFEASIAGSGEMRLAGTARSATLRIAGSGDIHALDLCCERAEASIAGSGEIAVHSTQQLDATISGSGDIRYRGATPRRSRVTGSGSITGCA